MELINFAPTMTNRGRNKKLIDRRDEKLLSRYYYWTEVERIRFDDALRVLSEDEFFLSEERVLKIIREKYDTFRPPSNVVKRLPARAPSQLMLFRGE